MTGNADPSGMRRGMELGADDYITKPMKLNELENSIRRLFPKEPKKIEFIG